jgi:hypothetical protein
MYHSFKESITNVWPIYQANRGSKQLVLFQGVVEMPVSMSTKVNTLIFPYPVNGPLLPRRTKLKIS